MTIPVRLENRAEAQFVRGAIRHHEYPLPAERRSETHPKLSTAELAFRIVAAFRAHPHINNVLTHIARAIGLKPSGRSTAFSIWRRQAMVFHYLSRTSSI